MDALQAEMDRRRPGQSKITTQRKEGDRIEILSGLQDGVTLGTPILMMVRNEDARSRDYDETETKYRPSHADFAYDQKYGIRALSGGGRASARETVGRVAAGALAKQILRERFGVEIVGYVEQIHELRATVDPTHVSLGDVEATPVRCPDPQMAEKMIALIEETRKKGDSLGGVVECVARGVPTGWGEPVFDKLEADLAKAVMSLPACKGFEIGSGFAGTKMTGAQHNDPFIPAEGSARTTTNYSGGIQGGISNGMPIVLRGAFKPTATIVQEQQTVTTEFQPTTISGKGRHDPCVLPRAVPMVEAMVALVLIDHALRQKAIS